MNKSIGALFALLAAAAVLAACNGTNNGFPGPGPTSTPSGNCGGPPNELQVIYPIPGSKNAPPNLPAIYVATKGALPPSNDFNFYLVQSNGNATYTGTFAQVSKSQVPSPHATPKFSNPTYYGTAIAGPYGSGWTIGNDQSVTLLWNDGGRNCIPHFLVAAFRTKKV